MADDSKTPDSTASDAVTPTPGIPDPNPLVPDASIEPAAQATAPAADTISPPLPADYEMPDDYATDDPVATVKAWVEEHPGLSILAAAGIGLVVGRVVTGLFPDPEPPSLADKVEKRARQLQKEAKKRGKVYKKDAVAFASTTGDSLQDNLHRAAEALREAAAATGDAAGEGYEKTKDLAETIADAAKVAVTGVLAAKLDDWVGKVRH